MHIVLRVMLLSGFAAAGVAAAAMLVEHAPGDPGSSHRPRAVAGGVVGTDEAGTADAARESHDGREGPARAQDEPDRDERDSAGRAAHSTDRVETPVAAPANPMPMTTPLLVPYQPAVTSQFDPFRQRLDQMEEAIRQQQTILEETLSDMAPQDEGAPAAADTLPPLGAQDLEPIEPPPAEVRAEIRRDEGDDRLYINVQNSDIRLVLDQLSRQSEALNILASPNVQGTVSASVSNVDAFTALEAILRSTGYAVRREGPFVFVGTPEDLINMDLALEEIETRIYRLNYVTAEELLALITPFLSEEGTATVGAGRITGSSRSQQGIPADETTTGGDDYAGNEVIVVRDYTSVLVHVDQLVLDLDRRPRQVAIEAMILSVRLDDSLEMGVNFELLRDQDNVRIVSGQPPSSLATLDLTEGGLKLGFLDTDVSVLVEALETIGDTNVVAAPRLLCLNRQRAEILIGSQLGYVSTTVTENAATQAIEFLEVGTQLRLRPFISGDNMIRLEVHPELSTGSVRVEQGFTLPDKEVTQVTTNVLCPDGRTVVLGGLIREDLGVTTSQIPVLGNLPGVGVLARQKTETIDRREIIILLTPHILFEPVLGDEGHEAATEFLHRQDLYLDKMSPLGKRYLGRRYLRLAQSAWNVGDTVTAFRYLNLAIHLDPQNLEATQLREEIVATVPDVDIPLYGRLHEGLSPWTRPHRNYTSEGIPWTLPAGPADSDIIPGPVPGTESAPVIRTLRDEP